MSKRSTEFSVGVFVFIGLILVGSLVLYFGKFRSMWKPTYAIKLEVKNAGGAVIGTKVLYAGIPVGYVESISLDVSENIATLGLKINNHVKIRSDAQFALKQNGLLGDMNVLISPPVTPSKEVTFVEPGTVIRGKDPFDFNETALEVRELVQSAKQTMDHLRSAVQKVNEQILSVEMVNRMQGAITNFVAATENAKALTQSLQDITQENRDKIKSTLDGLSSAAHNLNITASHIDAIVADNDDEIVQIVQNLKSSSENLKVLIAKVEHGNGTLAKLVNEPGLHDELKRLISNWRRFGIFYKDKNKTVEEDNPGSDKKQDYAPKSSSKYSR